MRLVDKVMQRHDDIHVSVGNMLVAVASTHSLESKSTDWKYVSRINTAMHAKAMPLVGNFRCLCSSRAHGTRRRRGRAVRTSPTAVDVGKSVRRLHVRCARVLHAAPVSLAV